MKHTTTVIIGAGQSGLAFSKHLTALSVDHVLLERGEVANSWVTQRWDSGRYVLSFSQHTPPTPGQADKQPVVIPVAMARVTLNNERSSDT